MWQVCLVVVVALQASGSIAQKPPVPDPYLTEKLPQAPPNARLPPNAAPAWPPLPPDPAAGPAAPWDPYLKDKPPQAPPNAKVPPNPAPAWYPLPEKIPSEKENVGLYTEGAYRFMGVDPPDAPSRQLKASTTPAPPELTPEEIEEKRGKELWAAARDGRLDLVKELLKQRAPIDYESREGWTPLMVSSESATGNYPEVTKELIASRANPDVKDDRGRSVLYFAAKTGNADLIRMLHIVKDKNAGDQYRVSPLNIAAREDKTEAARALLKMGANPHHPDSFGGTPYKAARDSQNEEMRMIFGIDTTPKSDL
mmetsp:Transcript_147328/g.274501  ORF Transcript_147328/g.274501 Transcript_147328/m.274501 type:complete len:311 (-) Transcript_147328:76-1008(-)